MEIQNPSKRRHGEDSPLSVYKKRKPITRTGFLYLRSLSPLIFPSAESICNSVCLRSDRLYTFGRKNPFCQIVIKDHHISKRHCQIFFDSFDRRIFIVDGFFSSSVSDLCEIRRWLRHRLDQNRTWVGIVRPSLNGVFVNGCRIEIGGIVELFVGDEVSFVCRNQPDRIVFAVERSVFTEEIALGHSDAGNLLDLKADRTFKDFSLCRRGHEEVIVRASFLLNKCRGILQSVDPLLYIRNCMNLDQNKEITVHENGFSVVSQKEHFQDPQLCKMTDISSSSHWGKNGLCTLNTELNLVNGRVDVVKTNSVIPQPERVLVSENCSNQITKSMVSKKMQSVCFSNDPLLERDYIGNCKKKSTSKPKDCQLDSVEKIHQNDCDLHSIKDTGIGYSSAGKTFFLNRLEFMKYGWSDQHTVVSLPQLVYPVESLLRIFVATFTSDVAWFLSCCEVPNLLPITIACHNKERCWSASHDKRTTAPYPDYPNLILLYPPFPEVIAFGKDRKKQGVACHHPKLLVLQREDSIRVIVTSANLVSKQWNNVTNTVWWQDFPRRTTPDYSSLFTQLSFGETSEELKSDFAAQLAGFLAALIADVPSQAHWISELTKYDFGGAVGHLVASVPGMHMKNPPYPSEPMHVLSGNQIACPRSTAMKFLGSVEASVVGLSHRFHTAADSNGAQLKTLAAFLGRCRENGYGMSEVILKRYANIPADANAVSVLVCDLDEFSEGDYIQLGFLPRNVAKWVAPLCDASFFSFSACIYPKEALAAALGGSNTKVQLILYVSQGPNFSEISRFIQPEHVPAICSLLASVQRCVGLWRLQEVLCRYKWPESLETDFIYGASSIGTSINAQFLAAFSAAAGKKSNQFSESEESDPEWGRWNASHELRSPSIRIIFPTIKTVSNGSCGIWPYRCLLSFPEKTWQRLRTAGIFHDAIPHPNDRVGYPMHVKVARRRFQSNTGALSFGWIYCGSHNFSPAAWGQPISPSSNTIVGPAVAASDLGSRLYICNYELGIIFIVPPPDIISKDAGEKSLDLDDIILPFVVPAPKYGYGDRPATAQAMREALAEVTKLEKEKSAAMTVMDDLVDEEIPDEEEEMGEAAEYVAKENEDEKVYAETLWSQVDSSES
ncbi:uncharacterized protein LOC131246493 [Magnolia sinica]|uniref:uncharacterized protein LOC131246493 n=1 Tax=Magnolia sinica TaxID=86752 RepID=UPI00265865ED|nr:uncharacterized protein LOC131246493 [Magnolia sinica]